MITIEVVGIPAAQGSKRYVGRGLVIESSRKVKPWRQDVTNAAIEAMGLRNDYPLTGALSVRATYFMPRPKSHYGTGRNAGKVKPSAPEYVAVRPDIEKLIRSTHDALTTAGVWIDDAQVAALHTQMVYANPNAQPPGASIQISQIQEAETDG